jgi:serine/threonine protein kinase
LWELFRKSRAAVAILSLIIIALVSGPAVVLIRRRLVRLSYDVELHQYLLADAEEDVLALQKGWQIGGDEVNLLARIDSDSPGAFGEVWKADWEGLVVCVKVLKQQMGMDGSLADFDAEISFLQRTRSPYLVRFFGAGQLPDSTTPFLVLELMELGSLDTFLARRAVKDVSRECRVSIVQDVARGMDYIHNTLHKLHRDLKSGNVLCTGSSVAPRVKIGDFGSIKSQFGNNAEHRRNTMEQPETGPASNKMTRGIGTPIYMAIEVMRGDEYDDKAEVWSYGVMLYEIATHRIPDLLTELPAEVVDKTRGPYLGHVLKLLEAGHRLELPALGLAEQEAPKWYNTLMARCMLATAEERPGFADIVHTIA